MHEDSLHEIFKGPVEGYAERFPQWAAACCEPFLRHLLERDFDIDHLRKAAGDIRDFQQWLLNKNIDLSNIQPSLIDEFIRDLRARFGKGITIPWIPESFWIFVKPSNAF